MCYRSPDPYGFDCGSHPGPTTRPVHGGLRNRVCDALWVAVHALMLVGLFLLAGLAAAYEALQGNRRI